MEEINKLDNHYVDRERFLANHILWECKDNKVRNFLLLKKVKNCNLYF